MTDIININKNQCEIDKPISDFKLKNCYSPNSKIYPLCKGKKKINYVRIAMYMMELNTN